MYLTKKLETMKQVLFLAAILTATTLTSCDKNDDDNYNQTPNPPGVQATVVSAAGDLTAALAEFRHLIGDSLNNVPGNPNGRREVNWDGVPPTASQNVDFPIDFFNNTDAGGPVGRKRGLVYANNGVKIRVDSSNFKEIDPSYETTFKPFSGKRAVIGFGSVITDALFKVAGTNTDGFVKGFGIIFNDVDNANSTTIEFFNGTKSLGVYKVKARTDANGFSFLGVFFPNEKITRAKITAGSAILATGVKDVSQGGTQDLVVYDDFFYNEPAAIN
jgi:hypothetical protein